MNDGYYILIFLCSILTGVISLIGAGGSFLTLPILIFIGLPINEANATNRIGVILQSSVGIFEFKKNNYFQRKKVIFLVIPSILGAILGALFAVNITETLMKSIFLFVMLFTLSFIFIKPQKWIENQGKNPKPYWIEFILFFLTGIYSGLIQAGLGFFLLSSLVLCSNFNLAQANAYKVVIVFFNNVISIIIFSTQEIVNLKVGLALGLGAILGGWIGSKLSIKGGSKFIRLFISMIIILASIKLFFT